MASKANEKIVIAVVGLGYVGLSLAAEFAKVGVAVIGFDTNTKRIDGLKKNIDENGEIATEELKKAPIEYVTDPKKLKKANFKIVAIPTPINQANQPDLSLVEKASQMIGQNLSRGDIVVYESTVYPGVTEEICLPILEKESGLKCGQDWFIGYSPERINPGDKDHTIGKITKVVSGMNQQTLRKIMTVYKFICRAGIHEAPNIKTAETAKVLENIQRDVNIALINEISLICHRLEINTQDVLLAAGTKWNFLKFRPGLVGGHCIGVDPYYLVYKAEELGYHTQMITAGRRINDYMADFVTEETIKGLIESGKKINEAKVLVMGLTFKEDIRDMRNAKIAVTIKKLKGLGVKIFGFDPNLTKEEIEQEFKISSVSQLSQSYDAVIVAASHRQFISCAQTILSLMPKQPVLVDINSLYRDELKDTPGLIYKNL